MWAQATSSPPCSWPGRISTPTISRSAGRVPPAAPGLLCLCGELGTTSKDQEGDEGYHELGGTGWTALRHGLQRPTSHVWVVSQPHRCLQSCWVPSRKNLEVRIWKWIPLKLSLQGTWGAPFSPRAKASPTYQLGWVLGPLFMQCTAGTGALPLSPTRPLKRAVPWQAPPTPRPASLTSGPASLIGGSRTSVWSRQWYLGTGGGLAAGLPKAKPGIGVSWVWESEGVPHASPGPAEPRV